MIPRVRGPNAKNAPKGERFAVGSVGLVDPGHLDGLQDLLAAAFRIIIETGQSQHPFAQQMCIRDRNMGTRLMLSTPPATT